MGRGTWQLLLAKMLPTGSMATDGGGVANCHKVTLRTRNTNMGLPYLGAHCRAAKLVTSIVLLKLNKLIVYQSPGLRRDQIWPPYGWGPWPAPGGQDYFFFLRGQDSSTMGGRLTAANEDSQIWPPHHRGSPTAALTGGSLTAEGQHQPPLKELFF